MTYVKTESFRGRATIQTLCNYLQELAGLHAAALGVSVIDIFKEKFDTDTVKITC